MKMKTMMMTGRLARMSKEEIYHLWRLVCEHERNRDDELDFIDKYGDNQNFFWNDDVVKRHDEILDSIRTSREQLKSGFRKVLGDNTLEF